MIPFLLPFRRLLLVVPLCVAISNADAQSEPQREVGFRAITWEGRLADVAFEGEEGVSRIDVNARRFTEPQTYVGPSLMRFFRLGEASAEDGEAARIPVGSVRLPEDSNQFLLIFLPHEGAGESRILAVPAGIPEFPPEYVKVWNLIDEEIFLQLNEERYRVRPRGDRLIYSEARGPENDESGLAFGRSIDVAMAYQAEGTRRQIYRSSWSMAANNRMLVFVYSRDESRPRVKTITEFLRDREDGSP